MCPATLGNQRIIKISLECDRLNCLTTNHCAGCPNRISRSQPAAPRVVNNRLGGSVSAIGILRQQPRQQPPSDPCIPSPCGAQADCRSTGNRAVCSCPAGYEGDPYTGCTADPCSQSPCGDNAICERNGEARLSDIGPPQHQDILTLNKDKYIFTYIVPM